MASVIYHLPDGTAAPSAMVQFGDRAFVFVEDARPVSIQANQVDSLIQACPMGIKPPMTAPTVGNHADDAANLPTGQTVAVAYRFYSSRRETPSQLSPTVEHTTNGKKLTISGFEAPRDGAAAGGIDRIQVFIQIGVNQGLMCVAGTMEVDVEDYDFAGTNLTFDLGEAQLQQGFDGTAADRFHAVPPAARYAEIYGSRLWLGGQRESVELAATGITVTAGQTFRGKTLAKLTLTGEGVWSDAHLYMSLIVGGRRLGDIFDVVSATVAYLDRDVPASIAQTQAFYLAGYNDRLWPTSWHIHGPGQVATPYPEGVNLLDAAVLEPGIDRGDKVMGLKRSRNLLWVIMREAVQVMVEPFQVGSPAPQFETYYGRVGTPAPGTICLDQAGNVAWLGEEGLVVGDTGGVQTMAHAMGFNQFFKDRARWVSPATLPNLVMTYSRAHDGYLIGGLSLWDPATETVTDGWWALITMAPQEGLWIFNGQKITSNLIEYPDANGQGVLLGGDDSDGRVKRLLDPDVLTDVQEDPDAAAAAFNCQWRGGWFSQPGARLASLERIRLPGMILPGTGAALTAKLWHNDHPARHEDDVETEKSMAIAQAELLRDIQLEPNEARFHSLGLEWLSTSGADNNRPIEMVGWEMVFGGEE
jgi:hypothetical protein